MGLEYWIVRMMARVKSVRTKYVLWDWSLCDCEDHGGVVESRYEESTYCLCDCEDDGGSGRNSLCTIKIFAFQ